MSASKERSRGHARRDRGHERRARRNRAHVRKRWSVRRFRKGSTTGPAFIEFMFPIEGGGAAKLTFPQSALRHPRGLLDEFDNRLPIFPGNVGTADRDRVLFLRALADAVGAPVEVVPEQTGFLDLGAFVTHSVIIRSNGERTPRPRFGVADPVADIVDLRGSSEGQAAGLLRLARKSTYLAFGIGVALAAPLPTYIRLRGQHAGDVVDALAETAVFNLSGPSSSGKSSVGLASLSLVGSPSRAGTFDFTRRGLAELASDHNDLLFVADDTERGEDGDAALITALKALTHLVPGGRSKLVSKGVDQGQFPNLRWTTFCLSSSPHPIPDLAAQSGWAMSAGDKVRLFDIAVPGPDKGGIFDRVSGSAKQRARKSVKLIKRVRRSYTNHHGHVLPAWVGALMAGDLSKRILKFMRRFVERMGAGDQGWEVRFAQKFAIVYAAMRVAVELRILPWPKSFPFKVAAKCYRKARDAAKTADERTQHAVAKVCGLIEEPKRVVKATYGRKKPITVAPQTIAIRYNRNSREKIGLLDDALMQILGSTKAKTAFTDELAKASLLSSGHGHAGTKQLRIPIRRRGRKVTPRPRAWVLDAQAFEKFAKQLKRGHD
jgi:hypothetical protein